MPSRRLVCTFVGAIVVVSSSATCISSQSVACEDGSICPAGTSCHVLANGKTACGVEAPFCGDGHVDDVLDEACDDGIGGLSGDGCTSRCATELATWREITAEHPSISITGRTFYGLATDPMHGLVLFGGALGVGAPLGAPATFGDTWNWNGLTWTKAAVLEDATTRIEPSIAYDPGRRRVVMFGGVGPDDQLLGDTFEWDGVTWDKLDTPGPSPRRGASLACEPNRCVLFGGRDAADLLADVWEWDGTGWTELTASLPGGPAARAHAVMTYDRARTRFVLFGGERSGGELADTWELDGAGWSLIASTPVPWPASKPFPAGAYDDVDGHTIVLVPANPAQTWIYNGGWQNTSGFGQPSVTDYVALGTETSGRVVFGTSQFPTLHRWSGSRWDLVTRPDNPGLANLSAVYDLRRGRTIVTSRTDETLTHEWNGRDWQAVRSDSLSVGTTIVYDVACGTTIGFGGNNTSNTGTAWSYDGVWTDTGIGGPLKREEHAMAYDDDRGTVLVFGGKALDGELLDDLWELGGPCDAKTWTEITPSSPRPAARVGAGLAYDTRRDVLVLFGGRDATGALLGDTWEWKQGAWTEVLQTSSQDPLPEPRAFHGMTFSPRLGRVILVGGDTESGAQSDFWQWDGETWQESKTLLTPGGLTRFALAPDITGGIIAVRGSTNPTIRLSFENPNEPTERCLADLDEDLDGLAGCDDPDCRTRCAPTCLVETPFRDCTAGPRCGDGQASTLENHLLCPTDAAP